MRIRNSTESTPLLKLQGLCKDFSSGSLRRESIRVIDSVDMDVHAGEIRGIVGESGSGKDDSGALQPAAYRAVLRFCPV